MTRDILNVQYPVLDHTESIANIGITKTTVVQKNGITIPEAFSNKNNSMFVVIESDAESSLIVNSGDAYPNSMLGSLTIELPAGTSIIQINDLSRFETNEGALNLDFEAGFAGSIYAIAKWAGVRTVS